MEKLFAVKHAREYIIKGYADPKHKKLTQYVVEDFTHGS